MDFQRARSDEQREARRRALIATATQMLQEMPVAELTFNEFSKRAGLAKSNVVRYFESREAILLGILDDAVTEWVTALETAGLTSDGSVRERGDYVAREIAESLNARPMLCDLISAQTSVLERNVSTEVVLEHKRTTRALVARLVDFIRQALPELSTDSAVQFLTIGLMTAGAAWPAGRPNEALQAAYTADPSIATSHLDFTHFVRTTLEVTLSGLLARQ